MQRGERAGERAFREFFNGFPPPTLSSFELPALQKILSRDQKFAIISDGGKKAFSESSYF